MHGNVQLILYALILLAGGLQTAYRWYQKKKVAMDAERAEIERKDTILRTGRDPLAEQAATMQRQAQQQEAAQGAPQPQPVSGGGGNSGGGGPITRELWPGGPVIVINGPAPAAPAQRPVQPQQTRPQALRPAQQPARNKKQRQQQRQQERQRQQPVQAAPSQEREDRHDAAYYERERSLARMQASTTPVQAAAAVEPVFVRPSTAQQWRQALIAAEILGTPVSMRDPRGGSGVLGG